MPVGVAELPSRRSRTSWPPTNTPVRAAREAVARLPGALQRLDGDLEQQALLGVHARRLARRDAEVARRRTGRRRSRKPPQRVFIVPGAAGSGS